MILRDRLVQTCLLNGGDDRAHHRDPERRADLASRGDDPRRLATLRWRRRVDRGGAHRREHKRHADPEEDEAGEQGQEAGGRIGGDADPDQARGGEQQADEGGYTGSDLVGQPASERRHEQDWDGRRKQQRPRCDRRVAQDVLEEHRAEDRQSDQRELKRRDHDIPARERRVAEKAEVQQRLLHPELDHGEHRDQRHTADQQPERRGRPPAPALPLHQAEHDRGDPGCQQHQAGDVDLYALLARLGRRPQRQQNRDQADGDVDEEDPAPADRLGEHPAEQRARPT